jgi:ketosteroid isomerase-like protein
VQEHPNAAALRRLFDALEARDAASVRELVAEDAVWTFPGRRGLIAGGYGGRDRGEQALKGVEEAVRVWAVAEGEA